MARGRKGLGVEIRENDYRIRFTLNGVPHAEKVALKPSIAHTKFVNNLAREVKDAISVGAFSFEKYFPDSPRAQAPDTPADTFKRRADLWRATRGTELAAWTHKKDKNYVDFWVKKFGADTIIGDLVPSKVAGVIAEHAWPSPKHRNNLLAALRGIFELWVADAPLKRINPLAGVENAKVQTPPPDPFDLEEVELILADMSKHYPDQVVAYFEFAFFTGMRPEEQIALRWAKVDARKRTARVDCARTAHGDDKEVKNHVVRDVDLNSRAWAALERMRPYTTLKEPDEALGPHVFENPRTGKPWASEADQRDLYWRPVFKRLRLRYRVPYQTRSTRATMMLMAGMNPARCAKQLGHSKRVFWERYADWIDRAERANDRERAKDEAAIAAAREDAA